MAAMVAAFRTLWTAMVGLYEETLILIVGNLAALALNLPVGLVLFLIGLPVFPALGLASASADDAGGTQWLMVLIAWLMPFLPTPGNVALAGLARIAAGPDVPRFAAFREHLRARWKIALRCTLVSVLVMLALVWNVGFYLTVGVDWLRYATILWLYATLFWLGLHIYLVPLLVHVAEPRLLDLYRRAAFIALGHFGYTLVLLLALLVIGFASVVFLPVYVLVGTAFISLVQTHALREIRRRHGDLTVEADEEVSRL
jgi:uncharacterized membrane protein YesL